jgi:hypothetical protein
MNAKLIMGLSALYFWGEFELNMYYFVIDMHLLCCGYPLWLSERVMRKQTKKPFAPSLDG